jgi:hypothetical protein
MLFGLNGQHIQHARKHKRVIGCHEGMRTLKMCKNAVLVVVLAITWGDVLCISFWQTLQF